ncbi:MAG: MetQ/NlpA family ABC transporter substrate-binding protein [Peptococcaceae bacterium]|nr:MetQ/NlpA family ABC transporter substrate-binding protein [Peptococcaceae bacterium]
MHRKNPLRPGTLGTLLLTGLLTGLIILLVGGCGASAPSHSGKAQIRIGLIPTDDNTLFYVADHETLFAQAGLDVEFIDFTSAPERDDALQAKKIDGEITDLMTVALRKKAGIDVSILCLCLGATPQEGPFSFIASPSSGIKVPADLAGANIGISRNTIIDYLTTRLLDSAGIASDDCTLTTVNAIQERMNMILSGALDAGVFPEPLASYAVSQGAVRVMDDTQQDLSQTVFFLTDDILKAHPEEIKTFMTVLDQARELYMADPEKYRGLITERVKVPGNVTETYVMPTVSPLQAPLKSNYDDVMTWMVEKDILPQPYTYEDLVDASFLPQ